MEIIGWHCSSNIIWMKIWKDWHWKKILATQAVSLKCFCIVQSLCLVIHTISLPNKVGKLHFGLLVHWQKLVPNVKCYVSYYRTTLSLHDASKRKFCLDCQKLWKIKLHFEFSNLFYFLTKPILKLVLTTTADFMGYLKFITNFNNNWLLRIQNYILTAM